MKFRAILFDLDGTLLDSVPVILKTASEVCATMGIPFDEARHRNMIGIPLAVQAPVCAGDRAQEFMRLYRSLYNLYQYRSLRFFPGTLPMLDTLHSEGYLTGLVTSKAANGTRKLIETMGLTDRFGAIVTADDVKQAKPHPEPILKALKMLDVGPDEAVYVGDSLYDIDAAQKANITMIGVSWGAKNRQELESMCPDSVVDTWQEFLDWLGNTSLYS